MILLGLETATGLAGASVGDESGPFAATWCRGGRRHGETLAPAVEYVLGVAGVALDDVGAVCVDVGPGLFTGLRVGVATAKGLAQGLGVGVIGLTSVEILARAAADLGAPAEILAVVDARRGEVFAARYRSAPPTGEPGGLVELAPPEIWDPGELATRLASERGEAAGPILAVGDGALRYADRLRAVRGLSVAGPSLASPPPGVLVTLAGERLGSGAEPLPHATIEPRYLRDADARANWARRQPPPRR